MSSIDTTENLFIAELPVPTFVPHRYRPGNLGTWSGHLPFAHDLIAALRPSLLVELGTHYGESYFGFCQSVAELGLDCICYAVDNWQGEAHSGFYGEEVFEEVSQYNEAHYRGFSYLLRTSFDDAITQFADGSIDLLHIDGLHTYEAISRDFRLWLPKVKPGGVILLHDIAVRHANFGVWRFWEELASEFEQKFAFHHWWGLGVLRKPGGAENRSKLFELLFDSVAGAQEAIRRHYVLYASYLEDMFRSRKDSTPAVSPSGEAATLPRSVGTRVVRVQVFPFHAEGHAEETSESRMVGFGWQELIFEFPEGVGDGPLRIDPADCPCVIELARISLNATETGAVIWAATDPAALQSLEFSGTAILLPQEDRCLVFSYGIDPNVMLPHLPAACPARLELSMRIDSLFQPVADVLQAQRTSVSETSILRLELRAAQAERMMAAAELAQVAGDRNAARRELKRVEENIASLRQQRREDLEAEIESLQTSRKALEQRVDSLGTALEKAEALRSALETDLEALRSGFEMEVEELRNGLEAEQAAREAERAVRNALEGSLSWQITRPLRALKQVLRKI